jgi:TP901 family phage tail tape measure protein
MPGIVYKIQGDNSQFSKDVAQSESIASGGFNKITALGVAAWAAIGAAVVKVTKSGMDFMKDTVNTGMNFDKSMSQVAATMGTTVDQIGNLSAFAQEMGATTAFSAQQAANGLNILAQSGLSASEQMSALPDVLDLAASGGLDLATSAKYVTGAVKGFGDSFDNASKYTDMIATGAAKANTNVNQLGTALSDSAATAASYGQTAEGTTLALLRLAEQNVTGAEASTALNRAMMDLYTPTSTAKKALDKLKVSAYDATGKARPLNDVIDDLQSAMAGMSDEEKNVTKNAIFSTFGLQAFNKMTVSSKSTVDGFKAALNGAQGSAKRMAETQLDNLAGDITLLKSASEGFKIALSSGVTPALRDFVQAGTTELGKLKTAFEQNGFEGLAKQLAKSISTMAKEAASKLPEVGRAFTAFFGTLGGEIVDAITSNAKYILQGAGNLLAKLGEGLAEGAPKIGEFIGDMIADALSAAPNLIVGAVKFVAGLADAILSSLPEIARGIAEGVAGLLSGPVSDEVIAANKELDDLKAHFDEIRDEIDVSDVIDAIDAKYGLANGWIDTFDKLSGKVNLTKDEQLKLNEAIDGLNGLLPDTAQIVQDETGYWSANTDAIKLNIEAQKKRAKAEAYLKASQKALDAMVEAEVSLKAEADLTKEYQLNEQGLRRTRDEVAKAATEVGHYLEEANRTGEAIMAQDLPAPARALAEQWGITGQVTGDQLALIQAALEQQAQQLEADRQAAEDLANTHQEAAETAQQAYDDASKAYEKTSEAAAQLSQEADATFAEANASLESYIANIEAQEQNAKDAALKIAKAARDGASVDLSAEGSNAGSSFASGITNSVGSVSAAAKSLAKAASGGVKKFLAIQSPSKVTKALGQFVTEGFAIGIEDTHQIALVENASEKVAAAGASALTSSIDSSISASPITGTENGKMDMIITLLATYLPNMGGDVVLDTGALVGHTIGQTDRELGIIQQRRARYE